MTRATTTDLLDAIRAAFGPHGRPDGEGWYTIRELADQLGISERCVARRVAALRESGKIVEAMGTFRDPRNIEHKVAYYRLGAK